MCARALRPRQLERHLRDAGRVMHETQLQHLNAAIARAQKPAQLAKQQRERMTKRFERLHRHRQLELRAESLGRLVIRSRIGTPVTGMARARSPPMTSQVSVRHGKLATARDAAERKAYWAEALDRLHAHLEG